MSLLLVIAGCWLPTTEGPTIELPRSWLLGEERSACRLRQSDVLRLLGPPDGLSASGWLWRWDYRRLGFWLEWERPVFRYCIADRLGPGAMALLYTAAPVRSRPLVWLLGARVTPRESLVEAGWSAWGLRAVWRCK